MKRKFLSVTRPRTHLELRVGDNALVSVRLHMEPRHFEWFNHKESDPPNSSSTTPDDDNQENPVDMSMSSSPRWMELYHLLQTEILPRHLQQELEDVYWNHRPQQAAASSNKANSLDPQRPPALLGPRGIAIGEKTTKDKPLKSTTTLETTKKSAKGRGRRMTKKQEQKLEQERLEQHQLLEGRTKKPREFYLAEGPTMQVWYKLEPLHASHGSSCTLVSCGGSSSQDENTMTTTRNATKPNASSASSNTDSRTTTRANETESQHAPPPHRRVQRRALEPLSQRLVLWCRPLIDGERKTEDDWNEGPPRMEYLPLSSLFATTTSSKTKKSRTTQA